MRCVAKVGSFDTADFAGSGGLRGTLIEINIFQPAVLVIVPIQQVTVVNPCNFNDKLVLDDILMISLFRINVCTWRQKTF